MFWVNSSNKIFHANNVVIYEEQIKDTYPYIVRATKENGQRGYIKANRIEINNGNSLSFAQDTFTVFYQRKDFVTGNKIKILQPKFEFLNSTNAYFFVASLNNAIKNFSWGTGSDVSMIENINFKLPIKNDKIDFEFMDSLIAELEARRIAELEAYLNITGLDDYTLTNEEEKAIEELDGVEWGEYKIEELFNINSSKKRFDANKVNVLENGKYPYIVRMGSNNGRKGFIDENEEYLNPGNTISFGQDTATIFYQEIPYFTGDKIKILVANNEKFRKDNSQFFITAMNKTFSLFAWGASRFSVDVLKEQVIKLPTKNGEIDYLYMETLINAVEKIVIKDVVLYKDKKIEASKKVIDKT